MAGGGRGAGADVHGGPGLSVYAAPLAAELDCALRVIRYQQLGLAPSTTFGPFDVSRHVADAIAVLGAARAGRVYVIGHSGGGHLAMHLASRMPVGPRGADAVGQSAGERLGIVRAGEAAHPYGRTAGISAAASSADITFRRRPPGGIRSGHALPMPRRLRPGTVAAGERPVTQMVGAGRESQQGRMSLHRPVGNRRDPFEGLALTQA